MFKRIASILLIFIVFLATFTEVEAASRNKKGKKRKEKAYRVSKHKRKSRHYKRGNGPDLKAITTESPYTEDTNNGINSIETKPAI